MRKLVYNRNAILKAILIAYFLLFFFSYFFFYIAGSAISGKAIYEEKQIDILFPEINLKPDFNPDKQKIINFFMVFGVILIAILITFYLSKFFHKKIKKTESHPERYIPFRKVD